MRSKRKFFGLVVILIAVLLSVVACGGSQNSTNTSPPPDKSQNNSASEQSSQKKELIMDVTLAGGAASGFWSAIGEAVGKTITSAYPKSSFTLEVGSGVGNIALIANNEVELGMVQSIEAKAALEGIEAFKEPVTDLQAVGTVYNNGVFQIVVRQEFLDKYGIKSMQDIKDKKPPIVVAVNQKGNMSEAMNRTLFEIYGFTYGDIKSWGGDVLFLPGPNAMDLMKDGKADLTGLPVQAPTSYVVEAGTSLKLALLELDDWAIEEFEKRWSTPKSVVPASAYDFLDRDLNTVTVNGIIMINNELSEEDGYLITKAMVENIDMLKNVGKAMAELTPEIMANTAPLPLHPGAVKYYREAGLIK